jgi:hypothetical protein
MRWLISALVVVAVGVGIGIPGRGIAHASALVAYDIRAVSTGCTYSQGPFVPRASCPLNLSRPETVGDFVAFHLGPESAATPTAASAFCTNIRRDVSGGVVLDSFELFSEPNGFFGGHIYGVAGVTYPLPLPDAGGSLTQAGGFASMTIVDRHGNQATIDGSTSANNTPETLNSGGYSVTYIGQVEHVLFVGGQFVSESASLGSERCFIGGPGWEGFNLFGPLV